MPARQNDDRPWSGPSPEASDSRPEFYRAHLLSEALVNEIVETVPEWRRCGADVRSRLAWMLGAALTYRQNSRLGGARRAEDIPAAHLRKLIRECFETGHGWLIYACAVWADLQRPFKEAAATLAPTLKRQVWNSDMEFTPHPGAWTYEELELAAGKLADRISGSRREQARLFAYLFLHRNVANTQEEPMPDRPPSRLPGTVASGTGPGITPAQRSNLKFLLRTCQDRVGVGLLRFAARDSGLLGKGARKADPNALKKLVADSDQLERMIFEAISDRARQHSAARTLQKVAVLAVEDQTLDHRARTSFERARKAFETGDWDSMKRSSESLSRLAHEAPHPLLSISNALVALLSGDLSRIGVALENLDNVPSTRPPRVSPPIPVAAHRESGASPRQVPDPERLVSGLRSELEARCSEVRRTLEAIPTTSSVEPLLRALVESGAAFSALELKGIPGPALAERVQELLAAVAERASALRSQIALLDDAGHQALQQCALLMGRAVPERATLESMEEVVRGLARELAESEAEFESLARSFEGNSTGTVALPDLGRPPTTVSGVLERARTLDRAVREASAQAAVAPPVASQAEPAPESPFIFERATEYTAPKYTGLVAALRDALPKVTAGTSPPYLPIDVEAPSPWLELPPVASAARHWTASAYNLLGLWGRFLGSDGFRTLPQASEFLAAARPLLGAIVPGDSRSSLDTVLLGLLFHSGAPDRAESRGRRRLRNLLGASNVTDLQKAFQMILSASAEAPTAARCVAEGVLAGIDSPLVQALSLLLAEQPGSARRLIDSLSIALAGLAREQSRPARLRVLNALGAAPDDVELISDYLDDCEPTSRRGNRPSPPQLRSPIPIVMDFTNAMAARLWERGRVSSAAGGRAARVSGSVPRVVEKGLYVTSGSTHVDVPILVRNGGDMGVAGIAIHVAKTAKGDSPITGQAEIHVPWLSDQALEETASVVAACRLEVNADRLEQARELRLALKTSWIGGNQDETFSIPLQLDADPPGLPPSIAGYDGRPMDLKDGTIFQLSSLSVQNCYKRLRDALQSGKPMRAVIHGRRRRGKSSICTSLAADPEIRKLFVVRHLIWNGPRLTRVGTAFETLAGELVAALAETGADVPRLDVSDLQHADEMSRRFLHWFDDDVARNVKSPQRVLLLLDEFQKWVAGLSSKSERIAILSALRHFNDRTSGRVEVAFVLSGLQNLKGLVGESTDLASAVEFFEVKELNNEEAERYIRERLPLDLDGRSRRRLVSLSGGNPYVLNRLGGNLLDSLNRKRRTWLTSADVDDLLRDEDIQSGRLAEFVKYMLCEDEEDGTPPLRQLTVLRTVASILNGRGDFDGYVRLPEVEDWLRVKGVEVEAGEPVRQLEQLVQLGQLFSRDAGAYSLRGEWLCRQLAALDPTINKLQPVKLGSDPDLVLGRYRKKQLLSKGGEAEIWLAQNEQEEWRDVVLRIYPQNTIGLQKRVDNERDVLSRIEHRNVVTCLGGGIDERHGGVIVLRRVPGQTLDELFATHPPSAQEILPQGNLGAQVLLFQKLADALAACHQVDVVHKDLSPRNVMATLEMGVWEPTIIDFGIAGVGTLPIDQKTEALGTPGYVAPERLRGGRRQAPADVFSLGALYFRMLTGRERNEVPSGGERQALSDASIPKRLADLVARMLDDAPEKRPAAAEVRGALETVLQPVTWKELLEEGQAAFAGDRYTDAISSFGRALSRIEPPERHGSDYARLLSDALEVLENAGDSVPWDTQWLGLWLFFARTGERASLTAAQVLRSVNRYYSARRDSGLRMYRVLVRELASGPPQPALDDLLQLVARETIFQEPELALDAFEAMARAMTGKILDAAAVIAFSVRCAEHARVVLNQPLVADAWLQRARRSGGAEQADYRQAAVALAESRHRSNRLQALPEAVEQEPIKIGADERAHLEMSRLTELDERVRRLFPFVQQLRRVKKDGGLKISRPTILRLDNIASHLPAGSTDPGNIIPLALDGSFTAERVPLRVNIVLSNKTMPSQREAALEVLKGVTEIFDFAGD